MNKRYFHFTLGPVQSFVAQARRTRDFWAGSFLLSWLSAVAIKAVTQQGGELLFPKVDADYLKHLENIGKKGTEPKQGCIPNRFKGGLFAKVPDNFNAQQVIESVQQAWQALAQTVWNNDLKNLITKSEQTEKIWNRQIKHFWEINWVLTNNENQSNLLDRRKYWRSYLPPKEEGVKCMMMDGWQELSGINTPNEKGLKLFWETLRKNFKVTNGALKKIQYQNVLPTAIVQKLKDCLEKPNMSEKEFLEYLAFDKEEMTKYKDIIFEYTKTDKTIENDLREGEYLCAIGFIKRRFAHVFHNINIKMPNNWQLHGWKVNCSVPSVSYMAAAPWLAEILKTAPEKELSDFHEQAKILTGNYYGEYDTRLECIDKALFKRNDAELLYDIKNLDGDIFFESALDNKNRHENQQQAQAVKKALINLRNVVNKQPDKNTLEPVSPFYAVLMMDGDSLGVQMKQLDKQIPISNALNCFTNGVANIVEDNSGFLIYAGGDDVLALLPLEYALDCAYQLRQLYLDSFEEYGEGKVSSTISAAIEYAHIKIPLGKVLSDAHNLLDDVAKNDYGRDSIAVRVWKPNGQHLQWARPWTKAVANNEVIINQIAGQFTDIEKQTPFSGSFFFNIEQRFGLLQTKNKQGEFELAKGMNTDTMIQLIAAEYMNSRIAIGRDNKMTITQAKEIIKPFIEQCLPIKRVFENNEQYFEEQHYLDSDAAHFIRFLVTKGVE